MFKIFKYTKQFTLNTSSSRHISGTPLLCIDQRWREAKGLPENPNAFGPLNSLPDYTFLDGRPTPMGSNLRKRLVRQQEIASRIVQLSGELDYAKQRHARMSSEKAAERKRIMQNKLKPKGELLLKKNK